MTYSTLRDFKLKVIESLGIELETSFGKIMIAAAYLPFQCTGENKNYFKGDLNKLTRSDGIIFIKRKSLDVHQKKKSEGSMALLSRARKIGKMNLKKSSS